MTDQWLHKMPLSPARPAASPGITAGRASAVVSPQGTHQSRNRCLTDETSPIHNLSFEASVTMKDQNQPKCLTMDQDDNPFLCQDYNNENGSFVRVCSSETGSPMRSPRPLPGIEDAASEVSSISHDSLKRYTSTPIGESTPSSVQIEDREPPPPPQEINVPASHTARIVPDWLQGSGSSVTSVVSSPIWETGADQTLKQFRPLGVKRGQSTPSPPLRPSGIKRGLSVPSLGSGCQSSPPAIGIYRDTVVATPIKASDALDATYGSSTRPWRPHNRGHSLAFSIGSLVGQSSYLTEPTTASSTFESGSPIVGMKPVKSLRDKHQHRRVQSLEYTASFQLGGEGAALTAEKPPRTRRRNPVKQEMLYVLGKVTKPVKNLVRSSSKPHCDLQRSAGCLT